MFEMFWCECQNIFSHKPASALDLSNNLWQRNFQRIKTNHLRHSASYNSILTLSIFQSCKDTNITKLLVNLDLYLQTYNKITNVSNIEKDI